VAVDFRVNEISPSLNRRIPAACQPRGCVGQKAVYARFGEVRASRRSHVRKPATSHGALLNGRPMRTQAAADRTPTRPFNASLLPGWGKPTLVDRDAHSDQT